MKARDSASGCPCFRIWLMLSGRDDVKLRLMLSECFEILRRVTSILYASLPSVFARG